MVEKLDSKIKEYEKRLENSIEKAKKGQPIIEEEDEFSDR